MKIPRILFLLLLLVNISVVASPSPKAQRLLQMIDYVAIDYPEAIHNGTIVNRSEYKEMLEFSDTVVVLAELLPVGLRQSEIVSLALNLRQRIKEKQNSKIISNLIGKLRFELINQFNVIVVPNSQLDMEQAEQIFTQECAQCHGKQGDGNGPLAKNLSPPPINFLDRNRYLKRTLYGLYSTITMGVDNSSMRAYSQLNSLERWSLAFYVGQLGTSETEYQQGQKLWQAVGTKHPLSNPQTLATITPNQAIEKYGDESLSLLAFLRSSPRVLFFSDSDSPLNKARHTLQKSLHAYQLGDKQEAYQLAVDAYLQGFEAVEDNLRAIDPRLLRDIEVNMIYYRKSIRGAKKLSELKKQLEILDDQLQKTEQRLSTTLINATTAYKNALFLLLNKAFEALLIILIVTMLLLKTSTSGVYHLLYLSLVSALLLSLVTWFFAKELNLSFGSGNETKEFLTALLATALLIYNALRLNNEAHQQHPKDKSGDKALSDKLLSGMFILVFVVAYRDIFELLLAYPSLWNQTNLEGQSLILLGFISALILFTIILWLLQRLCYNITSLSALRAGTLCMLMVSTIFIGKGISALQKSGNLPLTPIDLPTVELLGIYPNIQGLLLQGGVLLFTLLLLLKNRDKMKQTPQPTSK
ncbi:MAG: c-type cytochrome [Gammaproteobacteria bacterium]|nr:c-type cytochrome [Gammaproteobacteria bacterium]